MSLRRDVSRLAIVIPAFNEERVIGEVVSVASTFGAVIVVNDGSTDNTESVARLSGALVVSHRVNLGYDKALATGLQKALVENFDFTITLDADGQHEPMLIEKFLFELMDGADLVIGVRDRRQRFSEEIFAVLSSILWGISDPLCGMKGYRLSRLRSLSSFCSYPSVGTELAIRVARSGWLVQEVPMTTRDRHDCSRFGVGFRANWRIIRAMLLGLSRAKAISADGEAGF